MSNKLTPERIAFAKMQFRVCLGNGNPPFKFAEDTLTTALAALDLAERMRWRDPKVELPPKSGYVLASLQSDEFGVSGILRDIFYTGKKFDIDITETVLAWLPLPEWEG